MGELEIWISDVMINACALLQHGGAGIWISDVISNACGNTTAWVSWMTWLMSLSQTCRTGSLVRLWLRIMMDVTKVMLVKAPCTAQPEGAGAYAPLPEHGVQHT